MPTANWKLSSFIPSRFHHHILHAGKNRFPDQTKERLCSKPRHSFVLRSSFNAIRAGVVWPNDKPVENFGEEFFCFGLTCFFICFSKRDRKIVVQHAHIAGSA